MAADRELLGIDDFGPATVVGEGAFGVVYEARQISFDRPVAIKVLTSAVRDEAKKQFERECQAIGSLSGHPHIVTVYESGVTAAGRPYIAMEFMPGGSLEDEIASGGRSLRDALSMAVKIAGAVETAHRRDVLHRDIKPGNVLINGFDEPKLADFGISKIQSATRTRTGLFTGSVTYAAPELLAGGRPAPASDVYSLGATLYELLSGRSPFEWGEDELLPAVIMRICNEPAPSLIEFGVPPVIAAVVEKALEKDPAVRFGTALELAEALREAQDDLGYERTPVLVEGAPARDSVIGHQVAAQEVGEPRAKVPQPPRDTDVAAPNGRRVLRKGVIAAALSAVVLIAASAGATVLNADAPMKEDDSADVADTEPVEEEKDAFGAKVPSSASLKPRASGDLEIKVTSKEVACTKDRPVELFKVRPGRDKVLRSFPSLDSARSIDTPGSSGVLYVVASRSETAAGDTVCQPARSDRVVIASTDEREIATPPGNPVPVEEPTTTGSVTDAVETETNTADPLPDTGTGDSDGSSSSGGGEDCSQYTGSAKDLCES